MTRSAPSAILEAFAVARSASMCDGVPKPPPKARVHSVWQLTAETLAKKCRYLALRSSSILELREGIAGKKGERAHRSESGLQQA